MALSCVEGPAGTGTKKIILPNVIRLESLKLFVNQSGEEKPLQENTDNIEYEKKITTKRLNQELNISDIAKSAKKNIQVIKEMEFCFIGEGDSKVFVGPVLQMIGRDTYSKFDGNKVVYFDENPLNEKGKFVRTKNDEIAITPANEEGKDFIIVISEKGTIIIAAGGFLVFKLPIVVVKSSGNYFTISGGPRNILMLKKGVHVVLIAKLDTILPIILLNTQKTREIKSDLVKEEKSEEGVQEDKTSEKPSEDVEIENLNFKDDEKENSYIQSLVNWINSKGYQLETGGGKAILSIGPYNIVRRGLRKSDSTPIAAKIIISEMDEINKRNGKPPQEIFIAKIVNHKNIVKSLDIFCVRGEMPDKSFSMFSFIIMELSSTDRLDKLIKREGVFTEDKAKQLFKQIASAVAYLHTHYIAHCNIRADNCLVFDKNVVKLCDFSHAENILSKADDMIEKKFISLKYMPPEMFKPENCDLLKVDIWMSGCLLINLLTANSSPFGNINRNDYLSKSEAFESFIMSQINGLPNVGINEKAKDLLNQMFKTDPSHRINASQVKTNDWFK